jgi:LuxR family maltose regulon positive regulatory protein
MCNLGRMQELQGRLLQAEHTFREAIRFASEQGDPPLPVTGLAHVGLGGLQLEWNDLPAAAQHLQEGLQLGRRLGIVEIQVVGHTVLAQVCQAQGNTTAALEAIGEAETLSRQYRVSAGTVARMAAIRARLRIMRGELAAAVQWAQALGLGMPGGAGDSAGAAYPREYEQITLAWLHLARGEPAEAAVLLERLLVAAETQGRLGSAIEIRLLLSLALDAQGREARALDVLALALTQAEPAGYVHTFVDKGQRVATSLRRVAPTGVTPAYVSKLLAAFNALPGLTADVPGRQPGDKGPVAQQLVEPLSAREIEVLGLIAAGLSNREIAAELVITAGTVKWHANNIFGKLQVKRRTEAVARARELGLL